MRGSFLQVLKESEGGDGGVGVNFSWFSTLRSGANQVGRPESPLGSERAERRLPGKVSNARSDHDEREVAVTGGDRNDGIRALKRLFHRLRAIYLQVESVCCL
jgi:hypothetical protein